MTQTEVWSCGGGTQSAAIAALIIQGRLPKPDLSLIVDTGRERSSTWEYVDGVLRPSLAQVGVDLIRVSAAEFRTVDLYSHKGLVLLPGFTSQSGEVGKLPNYCSAEWKRDVSARYLRSLGVKQARNWIGISIDEISRVRTPRMLWLQLWYPLIFEMRFRRKDCVALIELMGWPPAPRTSCWMCPNMSDAEWLEMKTDWTEDFVQAVQLEREIRKEDEHFWLHHSCKPLDEVDFTAQLPGTLTLGCDSGECFV